MHRSLILGIITLGHFCLKPVALPGAEVPESPLPLSAVVDPGDTTLAAVRALVEQYSTDYRLLQRVDPLPLSEPRRERLRKFHRDWLQALARLDFDSLNRESQIDYLLLRNQLRHELHLLILDQERDEQVAPLVPFADTVLQLDYARRAMEPVDAEQAAAELDQLCERIAAMTQSLTADQADDSYSAVVINRAAGRVESLRRVLRQWHEFYAGYDPTFTWWTKQPYQTATDRFKDLEAALQKRLRGDQKPSESSPEDIIVGDPIGRPALLRELEYEMIAYSPEELIEIAEREFDWCEQQRLAAARELGFGDDWRQALNHVKQQHVPPGEQPELIRKLAVEAIEFLEARDLVTIPPLCRSSWRMTMMTPQRQLVNPYFTGGEVISVSFPTDDMAHRDKLMSLRGNNIHFSRATVHHELIPGHHLQGYMADRHRTHRRIFRTAFLVEGWALYWEMLLWDLDFPQSAADRMGMLFWRSHRCARIIFSLRYHLGEMTAQEAIGFLIERVGHERRNATGEVRRSVSGGYGPLYQAAYMLGGLQIRALRRELVESGRMTDRDFHDAILRQNSIPIDMIRASLTDVPLSRDYSASWKFYPE